MDPITSPSVLFVHQNFPAQFVHLATAVHQRGWKLAAIGSQTARPVAGGTLYRWTPSRVSTPDVFLLAQTAEADFIRAEAAVTAALEAKNTGFEPDVIIGHPGWGEMLFLREVFPQTPIIAYAEYFVARQGGDVGFDLELGTAPTLDYRLRGQARNAMMTLPYLEADQIVAPTAYQASLFPPAIQKRCAIIHEGIDTQAVAPMPARTVNVRGVAKLGRSTPLITFINRNFEPARGFHILLRALPKVLKAHPTAHVLMIGGNGPGYAPGPETGTWKNKLLAELGEQLDLARVHFVGTLPHEQMIMALQASTAHVYYSYPFVLSWSVLEAMACGCLVLGSDTAPVREVIEHGVNGYLGDFFDSDALADRLIQVCSHPNDFDDLRQSARATIEQRFDRDRNCLPAWLNLIDNTLDQAGK